MFIVQYYLELAVEISDIYDTWPYSKHVFPPDMLRTYVTKILAVSAPVLFGFIFM